MDENTAYNAVQPRRPRSPLDRQKALAAALVQDPGVKHGSRRAWHMYLIVLCACFCSSDSGFDGTVMGGVNSMHQYQTYFGMTGAGVGTSIVFGIYTVGSLTGTIPASILPDRYGRRVSMFVGNIILIIGAFITGTATTRATFVFGRFLTGIGGACAGASAKSYLAEMTAPQDRGLYLGILNSFYYVGQISATGMMVSTGKYPNNWSWRLPLFVQVRPPFSDWSTPGLIALPKMVPAIFNAVFIFMCPESPRWLHTKGRRDEARKVLADLHSSTGDLYSPLIDLEMEEIEEKVAVESYEGEANEPLLGSDDAPKAPGRRPKHFWDFSSLFKDTPGTRYRTYMVIMIGAFGQLSGNGMVTYFLPNLLVIAGITDQTRKLTLNFLNSITSFMGALSGAALVDRIGRRSVLLWSTAPLVILLAIASALLSDPSTSPTRGSAGIVFIYLFMVVFSFGWTPMQALYPSEVLPYENRAKGLAFGNIITQGSSCLNTFGLPIALQLLNWKVMLIFVFWDTFETIVLYLFVVETKGLTLEEIDEVFAHPDPRKFSVDQKMLRAQAALRAE
ncbi:general substrate transporter [Sistotremastrum niveocremeum HHB9708]|uniref:General substrate transporter n=1 Tax=Sistotremastrum niveocremeum HHB9708 TaxID=1314777 RepID=A0A164RDL1_9AGAM|nr:general substrate transporter [Sistotremastrum niveocremeum HHB9708]